MIDYRYKTFIDLVETKNYTKTAERLNFSQPAVTKHIQYIENKLNVKLFTYEDRQLTTTAKGQFLYEKMKEMLHDSEEIVHLLQDSSNLRIGASKTIGEYLVTEKIQIYNQAFPNSEVSLMVDNTAHLLDLLQKRKIDLALISGPVADSSYEVSPFFEDNIILICAPDHPLANRTVTLTDILQCRLLIREQGSGILKAVHKNLQHLNLDVEDFKQVKTFGSIALIKSLVRQNQGVSFMYEMSVAEELATKKLRQIHLSNFNPKQTFYAVTNSAEHLNDATDYFLTLFK